MRAVRRVCGSVSSVQAVAGSEGSRDSAEHAVPKDPQASRPRTPGISPLSVVRDQYRRQITRTPQIRMIPATLRVDGRDLHYSVSDNVGAHGPEGLGSPPIWAVNIHGYFAGGSMYWRESARLAERLGWRIVNPSLPGFGGSDPLPVHEVSLEKLSEQVRLILDEVGAGAVVLLGHSMGGAVAVRFASDSPERTLGIVYRDGIATPAWRQRRGPIASLLAPIAPDIAPLADLMAAVVLDSPDLLIGRLSSTMRSLIPDMRRNMRSMGRSIPVGSMLMTIDLREEVRRLAAQQMPILPEWGCFDRVVNAAAASEFSACCGVGTQWVPGGHSWMLARPSGQADLLSRVKSGRKFVDQVEDRWLRINARRRSLRAL